MPPKLIVKAPDTPPENAEKNQFNRFQPEMPRIPGVSDGSRHAASGSNSPGNNPGNNRMAQIVAIAAAVFLIVAAIFWWSRSKSRSSAGVSADPEITEESSPVPAANFSAPQPVHEGPIVAATVDELSRPWAAKQFNFVKPITHENIDAMVMRLPGGNLWAFSLQAPYGTCKLEYVTNLDALASAYRFRAVHPMVVNPCDSTVFDPLKVGTLDGNTWARGQIVQGSSLRPPIAIDVKVAGRNIVAEGIE
ncbi:MAG TPA: hypothetical protein VK709_19730 [Candidatus Saccharimonadales bacterium]|jgi:hypothetical protein|nr:hypothetical protein [Candidatus Saccharimonadales bacterium]